MPKPLLPSLIDEHKIAISERGQWVSDSQTSLTNLIDSLKVAVDYNSRISSIPDVWARVILFEQILKDETHPLYKQYVAEWRGLMAILAFYKVRNFSLKMVDFQIPTPERCRESDPEFLKVVARSLPSFYTDEKNMDKTLKGGIQAKIQVIVLNNKAIAIVTPNMLVCPAVDMETRRVPEVSWWKLDGLKDPIDDLSEDEKILLYYWLKDIFETGAGVLSGDIEKIIINFQNDLEQSISTMRPLEKNVREEPGNGLGITGPCGIVDQAIVCRTDSEFLAKSQVLLRRSEGKTEGPEILVLAQDIETQWNTSASDIVLGGMLNVGTVLPRTTGVLIDKYRVGEADLKSFNAEMRMTSEFFTDALALVEMNETQTFKDTLWMKQCEYGGRQVNVILPLKKDVLNYFTAQDIADKVSLKVEGTTIEVSLQIPVTGNDSKFSINAKKRFKPVEDKSRVVKGGVEGVIISYTRVPLLQIWPNIVMDDPERWKLYYTYYDCCDYMTFKVYPIWEEAASRLIYGDSVDAEIRQGERFPEAFSCTEPVRDKSGMRRYSELRLDTDGEIELGLLLTIPPKPIPVHTNSKKWKIGIDFGTTNTVAYKSVDGDEQEPICLQSRMYTLCHNIPEGVDTIGKNALRRNFISPYDQPYQGANELTSWSIKTLFHLHFGDTLGELEKPLFKGNIYYLDGSNNIHEDQRKDSTLLKAICAGEDMKWNENEDGRENMRAFLRQLLAQCLLEAVVEGAGSLEVYYSYPLSFSRKMKKNMKTIWVSILSELRKATSIDILQPQTMTESQSVAKYFQEKMSASVNQGMVCLDIGGGSTDIAVWQGKEKKNLYQTSLRFAGKSILNTYLWSRQCNGESILSYLESAGKDDFNEHLRRLASVKKEQEFYLQLEAILKYYEKNFFDVLPAKAFIPEVAKMISSITFALAGIIFYCGIIIGVLRKQGIYTETDRLPYFYVGGNASKLFTWASEGQEMINDDDEPLNEIFRKCFLEGLKQAEESAKDKPFSVIQTKAAKEEVAYGLVSNMNISDDMYDNADSGYIAGETFYCDGTEKLNTEFVAPEDYDRDIQISKEKPEAFSAFLTVFNKVSKDWDRELIKLSDREYMDVCSAVNQRLADLTQQAVNEGTDSLDDEPIFLMILKEVFNHIAKR